jgi:hypothetical protein
MGGGGEHFHETSSSNDLSRGGGGGGVMVHWGVLLFCEDSGLSCGLCVVVRKYYWD